MRRDRWGSCVGQADGPINRLKTLKRAKYGRDGSGVVQSQDAVTAPHKVRQSPFKGYATATHAWENAAE